MQKLKKIDSETNVLTWFEIPVVDIQRAKNFYETILDITMIIRSDNNNEAAFFPYDPNIIQATSGRVTGVLSKSEITVLQPPEHSFILMLARSIQEVLDKVEQAGGKIIVPKTKMNAGFIAVIKDSEGNRVGLHAED